MPGWDSGGRCDKSEFSHTKNYSTFLRRSCRAVKGAIVCLGLGLPQIQAPFREKFKNSNQILSEAHNPVWLCLLPFAFRLPNRFRPRGAWPWLNPSRPRWGLPCTPGAPALPPQLPLQGFFTGGTGLGFSGSRWCHSWERWQSGGDGCAGPRPNGASPPPPPVTAAALS